MLKRFEQWLKRILRFFLRVLLHPGHAPNIDFSSIRSILVIRQHNQLGDMLCVVPLLRALRERFPRCQVVLMASPVNSDVMMHNRYLDRVINFDKREFLGRRSLRLRRLRMFVQQLRYSGFDMAIVPSTVSTSFTSDFLAFLSGARYRVGAGTINEVENPGKSFFNLPVDLDWRATPHRHQTLRNLDIAAPLRVTANDLASEITLTEPERERAKSEADRMKGGKKSMVVFHPGAGKAPNRWPADRFARLAGTLHRQLDAAIVITAGPMDAEQVSQMKHMLDVPYEIIDNLPIREVAAILANARLVVSNDTGIMHVAAAVGTPVLSLFGPTDPEQWAPTGSAHRCIRGKEGKIESISVEEVLQTALGM